MRGRWILPFAMLVLSGCGGTSPKVAVDGAAAHAEPVYVYQCRSGRSVEVSYPDTDTAVLKYGGRTIPMTIAVSASGSRYVGSGIEWWAKGSGPGAVGSIFRQGGGGAATDAALEFCHQTAVRKRLQKSG